MPIYEYLCDQCGLEFEVVRGFSDKPVRKCEACGGKVHKLVSQSAFHLKGSGWYVTDYSSSKRPGSKPVDGKDGKPSSDSAAASDKKSSSDSKPSSAKPDSTPSAKSND